MVSLAQEQAFRLIGEHRLVEEARKRAQEMLAHAEHEGRQQDRYGERPDDGEQGHGGRSRHGAPLQQPVFLSGVQRGQRKDNESPSVEGEEEEGPHAEGGRQQYLPAETDA